MEIEITAKAVYEILKDVYEESPWTREQVRADLLLPNTDYFYVYNGNELIGFLSSQDLIGEIEMTNIAVKKEYQHKGYAKTLMTQLIERPETLFLEVRQSNQNAQRLYHYFGFEIVGKRPNYYHQPIEDAIIMKRQALL